MPILTVNNKKEEEFLRAKTKEVDLKAVDKKELRELIRDMRRAMRQANGIGLSANQIGIDKRIFVAQIEDPNGRPKFYAVINPKITKKSSPKHPLEEGCLSVPGVYGIVDRYEKVVLEGFNPSGRKIKIKAWGLLAHIFQHEVDHLDGKLFIDKAKEVVDSNEPQAA